MLAAQQQAVDTGQSVRVDAKTTQTTTVDANPDGTFTEATHLLPVRVKKNGAWTKVNAALVRNADGTYSPTATPNAVTLSGGGTGPLVTLTHADGASTMRLALPFTLPTPQVSGDTALYKSVLPDVDLSVSVTAQGGFSDVLIVHNATAAANPQLKNLTLAAATQGLSLKPTTSGGMQATRQDGSLAYISPRPLMWDSTLNATAASTLTAAGGDSAGSGDQTTASSADGPGTGALVDPIAMTTSASGLTLAPTSLCSLTQAPAIRCTSTLTPTRSLPPPGTTTRCTPAPPATTSRSTTSRRPAVREWATSAGAAPVAPA